MSGTAMCDCCDEVAEVRRWSIEAELAQDSFGGPLVDLCRLCEERLLDALRPFLDATDLHDLRRQP